MIDEITRELAFAREQFLETFRCLPDCQDKLNRATDPTDKRFYATHVHSDKISLEFWAGQITYLEKLLSQEKSGDKTPPPLEFKTKTVYQATRTGT